MKLRFFFANGDRYNHVSLDYLQDNDKHYRISYIQLDSTMSYTFIRIHKNINCTINLRGENKK